jgi:tRNA pseudouridine55 synthase
LGADIAKAVQTIGYITFLRRTGVGNFRPDAALKIDISNEGLHVEPNEIISHLKPIDAVLDDIPVLHLDMKACSKLSNGLKIPTSEDSQEIIRVYLENEKLIAICSIEDGFLIPKKVFNL